MVFTFARVDPDTLTVTLLNNTNGGARWSSDDLPCEMPHDILSDTAVIVNDLITLVSDPVKVAAKTAQAWTALRTQRNQLLQQSDYTQLQDSHLSAEKKSAWTDYRQALRDLPDEVTLTSPQDLDAVTWPTPPS